MYGLNFAVSHLTLHNWIQILVQRFYLVMK